MSVIVKPLAKGYHKKQEGNAIEKGKVFEFNSVRKRVVVVEFGIATTEASSIIKDKFKSTIRSPIGTNINLKGQRGKGDIRDKVSNRVGQMEQKSGQVVSKSPTT